MVFVCKPALLITLIVCAVHENCSRRESRLYCVDWQVDWLKVW